MAFDLNTPLGQELIRQGQAQGYGPAQIAGVLGGAMTENGLNTDGTPGDNGTAFGGFQWRNERAQALQQRAAAMGLPWTDPRVQAAHIYGELGSSEAGAGMADAQTPQDATDAIVRALRPHAPNGINTGRDPQAADNYSKYLNNTLMAYRALNGGSGGDDGSGMQALAEGRSASAPSQMSGADSDNVNSFLATMRGQQAAQNATVPSGGLLDYFGSDPGNASFGDRLTKLGAALMMRDNPTAAATMLNSIKAQQKANALTWKDQGTSGDGKFEKFTNDQGQVQFRPIDPQYQDTPDDGLKPATSGVQKQYITAANGFRDTNDLVNNINNLEKLVVDNNLSMNIGKTGEAEFRNNLGLSDKNAEILKNAQSIAHQIQYAYLVTEGGQATKAKMQQTKEIMFPAGADKDPAQFLEALERAKQVIVGHNNTLGDFLDASTGAYKGLPTDITVKDKDENGKQITKKVPLSDWRQQQSTAQDAFENDFAPKRDAFAAQHFAANSSTPGTVQKPVQVQTPADARKLPPGTQFVTPDGRMFTR